MKDISIDNPNYITYSNYLFFNKKRLAFRKKNLFDITTNNPIYIPRSDDGWYVNRQLLTVQKTKEILVNKEIIINISHLQWYIQEELIHCFNLNKS
jgi:uncharacterized NAD(P)/FAD-binding protein YdhS